MSELNAMTDLRKELQEGETIEAIVFGEWGWAAYEPGGLGYGETRHFVPLDKRGVILSAEEAEPFMAGWSFNGGYGSPDCYAVNVWTDRRVLWVTQYYGSTRLSSAPRNPVAHMPDMPGG